MSDTRFKWLVTAGSITLVAIAAMIIFRPRESSRRDYDQSRLGEYVYVDRSKTVHADRKCRRLNYKYVHSERIPLDSFRWQPSDMDVCPLCVSDADYLSITQNN